MLLRVLVCALFFSTLNLSGQAPLLPRIDSIRLAGYKGAGAFSPGAYAFVSGTNLGTQPAITVNGIVAPVLFADTANVAFQVPVTVPIGLAPVVLRTLAGSSAPFQIVVAAFSPAIFSLTFGVPPLAFFERSPGVLEFNPFSGDRLRFFVTDWALGRRPRRQNYSLTGGPCLYSPSRPPP